MIASHAHHVNIPGSPFGKGSKKPNPKTGWLSRDTFEKLPERHRVIAEELQRQGEIVIE